MTMHAVEEWHERKFQSGRRAVSHMVDTGIVGADLIATRKVGAGSR